jgi:outer membrane lipoprotein-sorting protein
MALTLMIKPLFSVIIFLLFSAFLGAGTLEDSYAKMEQAYAGLTSWQATLNQTNYFAESQTTLKSLGNCYYRNSKVAIYYTKPAVQSILIAEGKVTVYDQASKTALKSALTSSVQSLNPVEIIRSYWQKSKQSIVSSDKGKTHIKLIPKSDKMLKEVNFTLNDADGFITSLSYKDQQGNVVTLDFSKLKINQTIPASIWKLSLPKGTRILNR